MKGHTEMCDLFYFIITFLTIGSNSSKKEIQLYRKLLLALAILLITCATLLALGTRHITRPSQTTYRIPDPATYTRISITNSRGEKLTGWASKSQHSQSVLLLHGIRSNAGSMFNRANFFLDSLNYNVLIMDQRAHGYSEGNFSSAGVLESDDIPLFIRYIENNYNTSAGIIGTSMGGAAATLALDSINPDFLILESVYPSLDQAIDNRLRKRLGVLSTVVKEGIYSILQTKYSINPRSVNPIKNVKSYEIPTLIIAGENDKRTTLDESKELFNAVKSKNKQIVVIKKMSHVDAYNYTPQQYREEVTLFLGTIN